MSTENRSPLASIGIVVLALAVFFCLVLPMNGDAMHVAMVCCFALAVLLGFAILIGSPGRAATHVVPAQPRPRPGRVLPLARAPDPIALGALLI